MNSFRGQYCHIKSEDYATTEVMGINLKNLNDQNKIFSIAHILRDLSV